MRQYLEIKLPRELLKELCNTRRPKKLILSVERHLNLLKSRQNF